MRPSAGSITKYETTCSWPLFYAWVSWFYHVVGLTDIWWQVTCKTNFHPTFLPTLQPPPPPAPPKKEMGQIIMKKVDLVVNCSVAQHFKKTKYCNMLMSFNCPCCKPFFDLLNSFTLELLLRTYLPSSLNFFWNQALCNMEIVTKIIKLMSLLDGHFFFG